MIFWVHRIKPNILPPFAIVHETNKQLKYIFRENERTNERTFDSFPFKSIIWFFYNFRAKQLVVNYHHNCHFWFGVTWNMHKVHINNLKLSQSSQIHIIQLFYHNFFFKFTRLLTHLLHILVIDIVYKIPSTLTEKYSLKYHLWHLPRFQSENDFVIRFYQPFRMPADIEMPKSNVCLLSTSLLRNWI